METLSPSPGVLRFWKVNLRVDFAIFVPFDSAVIFVVLLRFAHLLFLKPIKLGLGLAIFMDEMALGRKCVCFSNRLKYSHLREKLFCLQPIFRMGKPPRAALSR